MFIQTFQPNSFLPAMLLCTNVSHFIPLSVVLTVTEGYNVIGK